MPRQADTNGVVIAGRVHVSKADVIEGLIASGVREFSLHGYEGASLRRVAAHADVTLGTIHRYFQSKADLYRAAEQRVWNDLNVERRARLDVALAVSSPSIEAILRALIAPIVARVAGPDAAKRHAVELVRTSLESRRHLLDDVPGVRNFHNEAERWFDAIARALPDADRERIIWTFSFTIGSVYSWQLFDGLYDKLLRSPNDYTADEITDMLVVFCSAGFRAAAVVR